MKQYYEKICQEDHVPEDVLRSIRQVFDTEKKARKYRRKTMEEHGITVCSLESLVNNEAGSRVMEPADQTKDTAKEVQRRILCSALRRAGKQAYLLKNEEATEKYLPFLGRPPTCLKASYKTCNYYPTC